MYQGDDCGDEFAPDLVTANVGSDDVTALLNLREDPADTDSDGVVDSIDNCPAVFNPLQENDDNDSSGDACDNCLGLDNAAGGGPADQCDSDGDGYGNLCDGDFNQDNVVGIPDFTNTFISKLTC